MKIAHVVLRLRRFFDGAPKRHPAASLRSAPEGAAPVGPASVRLRPAPKATRTAPVAFTRADFERAARSAANA